LAPDRTRAAYAGNGSDDPPWWPSRYGSEDTRGAGNELTPDRLLAALEIPRRGEVFQLALPLHADATPRSPRAWTQSILLHGAMEEHVRSTQNHDTYLEELVVGSFHSGCHVDALGHSGIDGRFYNGRPLGEIFAIDGLRGLGAEQAGPWIARGVCLDIAAVMGIDHLDAGFAIDPGHLEEACGRQGVSVSAGDVVLLHTGWARFHEADGDRYRQAEPGAGWDAAHWLTDRRVSLVGADNWGFETVPAEPGRERQKYCVHQHLLAETGTHILENIDTGPLVRSGESEFLFVAIPPRIVGATAAPLNPLAVV
jgi:kynurenine formamidase